jgi:hypothetical protein
VYTRTPTTRKKETAGKKKLKRNPKPTKHPKQAKNPTNQKKQKRPPNTLLPFAFATTGLLIINITFLTPFSTVFFT